MDLATVIIPQIYSPYSMAFYTFDVNDRLNLFQERHASCDHYRRRQIKNRVTRGAPEPAVEPWECYRRLERSRNRYLSMGNALSEKKEGEFLIGFIICQRYSKYHTCMMYLVHWAGSSIAESTWESACSLPSATTKDFHTNCDIDWMSFRNFLEQWELWRVVHEFSIWN